VDEVLTDPVVDHTFILPGPFTVTLAVKGPMGVLTGISQTLGLGESEERG